jgi:hypothetical protein
MNSDSRDRQLIDLLPSDTDVASATAGEIADLSEIFYNLFDNVRPLGQRDLAYFHGLLTDFGQHLDLGDELKRFQAWSLDKGDGAVPYPRSRFRDWLRRALDYHRHYGGAGRRPYR